MEISSTWRTSLSRSLILGAGVSGLAAARLARDLGHAVTLYDEKAQPEALHQGFSLSHGAWDSTLLDGIDLVIASPGFSERSLPVVETLEFGLPVISEVEFASRLIDVPLAAITGTNGKTTVTEATSAMLETSGLEAPATGNIGAPLSDFANERYDALVVEVSSFQLRFIEDFHPAAAAITNVAEDHLDWHGSVTAYRAAKARIFENQDPDDLLVYDADDEGAASLAVQAGSHGFPVSGNSKPEGGGGPEAGELVVEDFRMNLGALTTDDPAHLSNLAMSVALSLRLGASHEAIAQVTQSFKPGRHRRSLVADADGILWINDSKATNPHAAMASIRAHRSVVLIAGGLAKGMDVSPLATAPGVRYLVGIGDCGEELAELAGESGRYAGTLDVAVEVAAQLAEQGDVVLLAPGCASFDQFDSYEARGDRFEELVEERLGGSQ